MIEINSFMAVSALFGQAPRVTQIRNLLKLSPEVIEMISSLGDPLVSSFVSERTLRPLLSLTAEKNINKSESFYQGKHKHIKHKFKMIESDYFTFYYFLADI